MPSIENRFYAKHYLDLVDDRPLEVAILIIEMIFIELLSVHTHSSMLHGALQDNLAADHRHMRKPGQTQKYFLTKANTNSQPTRS